MIVVFSEKDSDVKIVLRDYNGDEKVTNLKSNDDASMYGVNISRFILGLNNRYVDKDIYIEAYFCEEDTSKMQVGGSQNRIDEYIKSESDAAFFMFFKKAGEYTMHELELAWQLMEENKKPEIYVFFKTNGTEPMDTEEIKKAVDKIANTYGHYYGPFRETDTIKIELLKYISEALDCGQNILIEDGKIYFDGIEMTEISPDNIFAYQNNKDYRELKKEISEIKEKIKEAAQKEDYDALIKLNREREQKEKDYSELEKNILKILMKLQAEIKKNANPLLIEALRLAELGKIEEALKVLPSEEIIKSKSESFESRVELIRKTIKEEAKEIITEAKTRIDILKLDVTDPERFNEIGRIYESVMKTCELAEDYETVYSYICFLFDQNRIKLCLEKALKIEKISAGKAEPDLCGRLYGVAAKCLHYLDSKGSAEEYYSKLLELYERLAKDDPGKYENKSAESYTEAGNFYGNQGNPEKAEQCLLKAIEIRERLVKNDPEKYGNALAESYNCVGYFYNDRADSNKAEEYILKAIEIRERPVKDDPEKQESALAGSYNSAGYYYNNHSMPEKAEQYILKSIKIREKLCKSNPERYDGALAGSYNAIGNLYTNRGKFKEAEEYILKAIEIRERLASTDPERYDEELSNAYSNAGRLYNRIGNDKAEEYYLKAIEIRKRLAKNNPGRYERYLANSYRNISVFYSKQDNASKAEEYERKALDLAKNTPEI